MLQIESEKLEELLGDNRGLTELREYLIKEDFTLDRIAEVSGILDPLEILNAAVTTALVYGDLEPSSALTVLSRLFVFGYSVPSEEFEKFLPIHVREILNRSGFVFMNAAGRLSGLVTLIKYEDYFLLSDRLFSIGEDNSPVVHNYSDVVWPVAEWSHTLYQKLTKNNKWQSFLDVGCGTGCMAILVHKRYTRVVGIDLNPRCILYSKINAKLNNVENVHFLEGNCFTWDAQSKFDHMSFAVPSGPSFSKSGAMVSYGGELGHELGLQFLKEGVDVNLSAHGCAELWCIFAVQKKDGSVLNLIKSSNPNLKYKVEVEEFNRGGMYVSKEDIENNRLPMMSHYSGSDNSMFISRLRELQITKVTPALVRLVSD